MALDNINSVLIKRLKRLKDSKDSNIKRLKCLYYNNPYADIRITQYTGYIERHVTVRDPLYIAVMGNSREDVVNKLCEGLENSCLSFIMLMDDDQLVESISKYYAAVTKKERLDSINWVIEYNKKKIN